MIELNLINNNNFNEEALQLFKYQAEKVEVYKSYLYYRKIEISKIISVNQIPFLPIQFFKTQKIIVSNLIEEIVFTSSGTSGKEQSKHYVADVSNYINSYVSGFQFFYGKPTDYCIISLLPSYLEREGSSLIYMCDDLIKQSNNKLSGFYLNEYGAIIKIILNNIKLNKKTLIIGVTYALLDFAEYVAENKIDTSAFNSSRVLLMETGGMKGKRKEMLREEVHAILSKSFNINEIHSEYGMTELLSQAYSRGNGLFQSPPWMKVLIRDINDPEKIHNANKTGAINIIDLANVNSCSFIATDDLGKLNEYGLFEVLGRIDSSDIRGCNLLI